MNTLEQLMRDRIRKARRECGLSSDSDDCETDDSISQRPAFLSQPPSDATTNYQWQPTESGQSLRDSFRTDGRPSEQQDPGGRTNIVSTELQNHWMTIQQHNGQDTNRNSYLNHNQPPLNPRDVIGSRELRNTIHRGTPPNPGNSGNHNTSYVHPQQHVQPHCSQRSSFPSTGSTTISQQPVHHQASVYSADPTSELFASALARQPSSADEISSNARIHRNEILLPPLDFQSTANEIGNPVSGATISNPHKTLPASDFQRALNEIIDPHNQNQVQQKRLRATTEGNPAYPVNCINSGNFTTSASAVLHHHPQQQQQQQPNGVYPLPKEGIQTNNPQAIPPSQNAIHHHSTTAAIQNTIGHRASASSSPNTHGNQPPSIIRSLLTSTWIPPNSASNNSQQATSSSNHENNNKQIRVTNPSHQRSNNPTIAPQQMNTMPPFSMQQNVCPSGLPKKPTRPRKPRKGKNYDINRIPCNLRKIYAMIDIPKIISFFDKGREESKNFGEIVQLCNDPNRLPCLVPTIKIPMVSLLQCLVRAAALLTPQFLKTLKDCINLISLLLECFVMEWPPLQRYYPSYLLWNSSDDRFDGFLVEVLHENTLESFPLPDRGFFDHFEIKDTYRICKASQEILRLLKSKAASIIIEVGQFQPLESSLSQRPITGNSSRQNQHSNPESTSNQTSSFQQSSPRTSAPPSCDRQSSPNLAKIFASPMAQQKSPSVVPQELPNPNSSVILIDLCCEDDGDTKPEADGMPTLSAQNYPAEACSASNRLSKSIINQKRINTSEPTVQSRPNHEEISAVVDEAAESTNCGLEVVEEIGGHRPSSVPLFELRKDTNVPREKNNDVAPNPRPFFEHSTEKNDGQTSKNSSEIVENNTIAGGSRGEEEHQSQEENIQNLLVTMQSVDAPAGSLGTYPIVELVLNSDSDPESAPSTQPETLPPPLFSAVIQTGNTMITKSKWVSEKQMANVVCQSTRVLPSSLLAVEGASVRCPESFGLDRSMSEESVAAGGETGIEANGSTETISGSHFDSQGTASKSKSLLKANIQNLDPESNLKEDVASLTSMARQENPFLLTISAQMASDIVHGPCTQKRYAVKTLSPPSVIQSTQQNDLKRRSPVKRTPTRQKPTKPLIRQKATTPPIRQKTTKTPVSQRTTKPPIRQKTTKTSINQKTTEPPIRRKTTKPLLHQKTTKPIVHQNTIKSPNHQKTTTKRKKKTKVIRTKSNEGKQPDFTLKRARKSIMDPCTRIFPPIQPEGIDQNLEKNQSSAHKKDSQIVKNLTINTSEEEESRTPENQSSVSNPVSIPNQDPIQKKNERRQDSHEGSLSSKPVLESKKRGKREHWDGKSLEKTLALIQRANPHCSKFRFRFKGKRKRPSHRLHKYWLKHDDPRVPHLPIIHGNIRKKSKMDVDEQKNVRFWLLECELPIIKVHEAVSCVMDGHYKEQVEFLLNEYDSLSNYQIHRVHVCMNEIVWMRQGMNDGSIINVSQDVRLMQPQNVDWNTLDWWNEDKSSIHSVVTLSPEPSPPLPTGCDIFVEASLLIEDGDEFARIDSVTARPVHSEALRQLLRQAFTLQPILEFDVIPLPPTDSALEEDTSSSTILPDFKNDDSILIEKGNVEEGQLFHEEVSAVLNGICDLVSSREK